MRLLKYEDVAISTTLENHHVHLMLLLYLLNYLSCQTPSYAHLFKYNSKVNVNKMSIVAVYDSLGLIQKRRIFLPAYPRIVFSENFNRLKSISFPCVSTVKGIE